MALLDCNAAAIAIRAESDVMSAGERLDQRLHGGEVVGNRLRALVAREEIGQVWRQRGAHP
ncbi:hypothetical protein, partial [Ilumatobacter sp.]|uniref:hypothetical protein n=1 Tax=Ilumatobacter sp. TaxID=1967498 RepID=UPI003C483C31